MSVEMLQRELDQLAKHIAQKDLELRNLKTQYNARLKIVNDCINNLPQEFIQSNSSISDEELANILVQPIKCPNCQETVHRNDNDKSDYILLPKRLVQIEKRPTTTFSSESIPNQASLRQFGLHNQNQNQNQNASADKLKNASNFNSNSNSNSNYKSKSKNKVTCSFCKMTGHTRANCEARLMTPKK